jgi:DnaJ-class molecular chaperone
LFQVEIVKFSVSHADEDTVNESTFDVSESTDELLRTQTFYELLDIAESADDFEIDHAFARHLQDPEQDARTLSARKHAWEVLRNAVNRSFYDEHLAQLRARRQATASKVPPQGVGSMSTFTLRSAQGQEPTAAKGRARRR